MDARVAVLDLGTNTFHLLIANIVNRKPQIIYSDTIAVKLGEGGISEGMISQEAFSRGISALSEFKKQIVYHQVGEIKCAATSAIRGASNGTDFIAKVRSETGIEIELINGDQEASLIYQGVNAAMNIDQNTLIIDIGGGSVEFIICDTDKILWKKSYPVGAARLMYQFHHSDPISTDELTYLITYLDNNLHDLKRQLAIYNPLVMIGSAGAFETFAALQEPEFEATFDKPGFNFAQEKLSIIINEIVKSTHLERSNMPQIIPVRVDMIVVAAILTNYILEMSGIKIIKLSAYSLKEGILFGMLK